MKKLGFIIATLIASVNTFADEAPSQPGVTVAAIEAERSVQWEQSTEERARELPLDATLDERSQKLNEEISAELDERLNDKLQRQLRAGL